MPTNLRRLLGDSVSVVFWFLAAKRYGVAHRSASVSGGLQKPVGKQGHHGEVAVSVTGGQELAAAAEAVALRKVPRTFLDYSDFTRRG